MSRAESTGYYFCSNMQYGILADDGTEDCVTCSELLGRGQFARPVSEVRYDVHGTAIHYEKPGRYRGLLAHEASVLSDALYYDLPGSPCLLTLRERWAKRAVYDDAEEPTTVDAGLFYDWGQVGARNYNEG